jgi:hypothetical protein
MGNKHVTNTPNKESSIHVVLQFSFTNQRDKDYCNAGLFRTTQNISRERSSLLPLRTLSWEVFLNIIAMYRLKYIKV